MVISSLGWESSVPRGPGTVPSAIPGLLLLLYSDASSLKKWSTGMERCLRTGGRQGKEKAWDEDPWGSWLLTFPKVGCISNTPSSSIPPVLSLCIWEGQPSSLSPLPPGSSYYARLWHFSSLPSCLSPLPAWSPVRTGTSSLWGREARPYRSNELMVPTRPSQSKGSWVFTPMDPLPELP